MIYSPLKLNNYIRIKYFNQRLMTLVITKEGLINLFGFNEITSSILLLIIFIWRLL